MHRARDVLELALAQVLEADLEAVSHLVVDGARDEDTAGLGERLEPRRDIDAVAEDVVALDDDVADVDADPKLDSLIEWCRVRSPGHLSLDLDGTTGRVHRTGELTQ